MDWTQQMEEMNKQWTEAQKKLWKNWADAAPMGNTSQFDRLWRQMLEGWQNSVHQMLDAQVDGVRLWAESVSANNAPENLVQGAEQFHQMTKQWISGQKQLWDNWFQMIEKLPPNQSFGAAGVNVQPMMKLWQETAQSMLHTQQEWMKNWSAPQTSRKG